MDFRRAFRSLAFVTIALVLASDGRAAGPREMYVVSGASVSLGSTPAESWKGVSPPGVDFEITTGAARPTIGKKRLVPVAFKRAVPGTRFANAFDTDLGVEVAKIAFDPIVIESAPATELNGFTTLRPGSVKPGSVTFTTARPAPAIREWMRGVLAGTSAARDVTVNVKSATGGVVRTIVLKRSLPMAYSGDPSAMQLVVRPEMIEVRGPASAAWIEWYRASLPGSATRRDIRILYSSAPTTPVLLKNAFLTEIRLGNLDGATEQQLDEIFVVQPDLVEPMP